MSRRPVLALLGAAAVSVVFAGPAAAHGQVVQPPSRDAPVVTTSIPEPPTPTSYAVAPVGCHGTRLSVAGWGGLPMVRSGSGP